MTQGAQIWPKIESGEYPAYWNDGEVVHSATGAEAHRDIFLMWTKCSRDVPAGQAHIITDGHSAGTDTVTCPKCKS